MDPRTGIEIDSVTDSDSAYGDEVSAFTASITSSVYKFPERYRRTYHAYREGQYMLPNDAQERERLDIFHALMRKCMGDKLCLAPVGDNPLRVIDLGTGTGIWAIEFGDEYPNAEVIGNDLTPGPDNVPSNVSFLVDDIEDDWGYEDNPFDLVHGRFLAGAVRDWPRLMRQAFDCTKAGGWVEFEDWDTNLLSIDNTLPDASALATWHRMAIEQRELQGFSMRPGRHLEQWVREAGFQNVQVHRIALPLGPWAKDKFTKEVGMYNLLQMEAGTKAICLGTLPQQGWSEEQIDTLVAEIGQDMRNRKIHAYYDFYIVYGQKPV